MTKKVICDVCQEEKQYTNQFQFRGHSSTDDDLPNENMPFWCGDICFNCQYKMRKSIDIQNKGLDIRWVAVKEKSS